MKDLLISIEVNILVFARPSLAFLLHCKQGGRHEVVAGAFGRKPGVWNRRGRAPSRKHIN